MLANHYSKRSKVSVRVLMEAAIECVVGVQTANQTKLLGCTITGSRGDGFHINRKL